MCLQEFSKSFSTTFMKLILSTWVHFYLNFVWIKLLKVRAGIAQDINNMNKCPILGRSHADIKFGPRKYDHTSNSPGKICTTTFSQEWSKVPHNFACFYNFTQAVKYALGYPLRLPKLLLSLYYDKSGHFRKYGNPSQR